MIRQPIEAAPPASVRAGVRRGPSRILGADIAINVRAEPTLMTVLGDRLQFEQVLMNLAVNAADAMKGREIQWAGARTR